MTEKSYATNVWTILGISAVLMLFIFLLVGHHYGTADRVRMDRAVLLGSGSNVAERIKPVAEVNIAPAETQREPVKSAAALPAGGSRIAACGSGRMASRSCCVLKKSPTLVVAPPAGRARSRR